METLTCKNCGVEFQGNFCGNCGQKKFDSKLNFKMLSYWIIDSLDYQTGLINTFLSLQTKPGVLIHDFVGGKTKSYFNPFTYLILSLSFVYFVSPSTTGWYILFVPILFISIMYNNIAFRRNRYNLFENVIIALLLNSQILLIWLIGDLLENITPEGSAIGPRIMIILMWMYIIYFNWKVFDKEKRVINILKSIIFPFVMVGFLVLVMELDNQFNIISTIKGLF